MFSCKILRIKIGSLSFLCFVIMTKFVPTCECRVNRIYYRPIDNRLLSSVDSLLTPCPSSHPRLYVSQYTHPHTTRTSHVHTHPTHTIYYIHTDTRPHTHTHTRPQTQPHQITLRDWGLSTSSKGGGGRGSSTDLGQTKVVLRMIQPNRSKGVDVRPTKENN